jgi:hypothetical protein
MHPTGWYTFLPSAGTTGFGKVKSAMTLLDYATPHHRSSSIPNRLAIISLVGSVTVTAIGFAADRIAERYSWAQWTYSRWVLVALVLTILVTSVWAFRDQRFWARLALTLAALVCAWVMTAAMFLGLRILFGIPLAD